MTGLPLHEIFLDHGPLREVKRQMFRRLPLIARVTQYNGQTNYWRSENISEGGIFVRSAPTLPQNTEMEIGFFMPTGKAEVRCRARVVWRNDPEQADFDKKKPFGMGLEFVDLNPQHRELIRRYIQLGAATGSLA